jgi:glycosyltransferase involved in cell wall biosynthesis
MTQGLSEQPLKVLFVLPELGVGGQERQLSELAVGLMQRGHTVDVAINHPGGVYDDYLEARGARVIVLRTPYRDTSALPRPQRLLEAARRLMSLRRLVSRGNYDIVHGYGDSANAYVSLADGLRHRKGLVWGVRASESTGNRISARLLPILSRRVDLVIANSRAGAAYVRDMGCRPARIDVIPNGIDVERCTIDPAARAQVRASLGIADDERLIGIIGNFHPRKGIPVFLEAASKLDPALRCRFLILGGDYWGNRPELDENVARLGIGDRVIFHPVVDDVERYMNALDVLVSASYTEGFSNVLAEGMACGVPCVATDAGDSRSILGDHGIVVPTGDPDAMAGAIAKTLAAGTPDREAIRHAITGAFTIGHLVDRSEAAFRRILDRT